MHSRSIARSASPLCLRQLQELLRCSLHVFQRIFSAPVQKVRIPDVGEYHKHGLVRIIAAVPKRVRPGAGGRESLQRLFSGAACTVFLHSDVPVRLFVAAGDRCLLFGQIGRCLKYVTAGIKHPAQCAQVDAQRINGPSVRVDAAGDAQHRLLRIQTGLHQGLHVDRFAKAKCNAGFEIAPQRFGTGTQHIQIHVPMGAGIGSVDEARLRRQARFVDECAHRKLRQAIKGELR